MKLSLFKTPFHLSRGETAVIKSISAYSLIFLPHHRHLKSFFIQRLNQDFLAFLEMHEADNRFGQFHIERMAGGANTRFRRNAP